MRENKTTDIYTVNVGGIEKPEIPIGEEGEKKGIPGFEAVFAIAGLLVMAYLLRRK
jgi:PGF-CTERM protein